MPDNNHKNKDTAFQDKTSYKRILKTTVLFGSASAITIFFRIVRGKIFALLVGPYGIGLLGMFDSITKAGVLFSNMGLPTSTVRQISSARGSENTNDINTTIMAIFYIIPVLSICGGILTWLLSDRISMLVFDTVEHSQEIEWLGLAIFLLIISSAFGAIIQGYQKIVDLASAEIFSAVIASVIAVMIIMSKGKDGIVFAVLAIAFVKFSVNLFYFLRVPIIFAIYNFKYIFQKIIKILRFGFLFMLASLLPACTQFIIRILITRELGIDHAGYFHAAHAISVTYIAFILRAMGRDYYPNLTRHAFDHKQMVKLVNEQIQVALVLGAPFIIALMTFAPLTLDLFYSESFSIATPLLQFFVLTLPLRFVIWPMGFVILAKGRGKINFLGEIPKSIIFITCSMVAIHSFGITGIGIGFLLAIGFHCPLIWLIINKLIGFKMTRINLISLLVLIAGAGTVFILSYVSVYLSYVFGTIISFLSFLYAWRELSRMIGITPLQWGIKKIQERRHLSL